MALYVLTTTSFSLPQSDPVRAFKMLVLDWTFVLRSVACCLKERRLSNVMPRILGFWTVGTISPSILTANSVLHSLEEVVKRVADDKMAKFLGF